jgi:hypothetical protein
MGWARGADVAHGIIKAVNKTILRPSEKRNLYFDIIPILEHEDWDTQDECMGEDPVFDAVMEHLHPDWDWSQHD